MDDAELEHLFDWPLQEPCQRGNHAAGLEGCVPEQHGTHLVKLVHGIRDDDCDPVVIVTCEGHCDWIRSNRDTPYRCPTCHRHGPLRRFVQLAGPIRGKDWTGQAKG